MESIKLNELPRKVKKKVKKSIYDFNKKYGIIEKKISHVMLQKTHYIKGCHYKNYVVAFYSFK